MKWLHRDRMRLAAVVVVISGFLSTTAICSAVEYIWTNKAEMPTPRWAHTSAEVNGKIYIIGGGTSEPDSICLSSVEEYDPSTDTWTRKADMPTPRGWNSPSSAVVDGRIYVIGGYAGADVDEWCLSTVEEYDPAANTWTRKVDMPTSRVSLATVAVDGHIYAIGGAGPEAPEGLKTVEMYDPATDIWTRKADLPYGVWYVNANVVNGRIYVLGGRPRLKARPWVQEYDPATDSWAMKADMPLATSQMASVVLGDKIIVIGGWLWSQDYPHTTVQMYDPQTDTWTIEADAPFQRAVFSADAVNNRIYAIGGTNRPHPCPALSTVYELTIGGPAPDFDGDGIVDTKDLLRLIESWDKDDSLVDIAPPPFGDGVVNALDLEFLMEHWQQPVDDHTLLAHWALDETEGIIAYDSASVNDAVLVGDAVWQPDSGQINGALQLDGINGYLVTGPILNPADGPCSVFAWINGGAPGQVVLSQVDGVNWLAVDAEGNLMTELTGPGRSAGPLFTEKVITDGQWHRIGLVWDGSHRTLYVDGVSVAEDTQHGLFGSQMGLNIGTGKAMEPGTYFSGLIDDIRIYNRIVSP